MGFCKRYIYLLLRYFYFGIKYKYKIGGEGKIRSFIKWKLVNVYRGFFLSGYVVNGRVEGFF